MQWLILSKIINVNQLKQQIIVYVSSMEILV